MMRLLLSRKLFIKIKEIYNTINHVIYNVKTFNKYQKYKELKLLDILFFWHNNGFAFISGFIGYKKHRYSILFYLWMCVFFYSVIIHFFYLKYKLQFMIKDKLLYNLLI